MWTTKLVYSILDTFNNLLNKIRRLYTMYSV